MIPAGTLLDNKYRVESQLGSGGFGEVYLARDTEIQSRRVAIKVLKTPEPEHRAALIREMEILVHVHHAHVVTFHHHFQDDERMYLVMEYCPGGSLDDEVARNGAQSKEVVFGWALDLRQALVSVHRLGIVHHDIKPANLLFAADGAIKLGDFGVANRNGGTFAYMPPEMLFGEAVSRTDARVDLYSRGPLKCCSQGPHDDRDR